MCSGLRRITHSPTRAAGSVTCTTACRIGPSTVDLLAEPVPAGPGAGGSEGLLSRPTSSTALLRVDPHHVLGEVDGQHRPCCGGARVGVGPPDAHPGCPGGSCALDRAPLRRRRSRVTRTVPGDGVREASVDRYDATPHPVVPLRPTPGATDLRRWDRSPPGRAGPSPTGPRSRHEREADPRHQVSPSLHADIELAWCGDPPEDDRRRVSRRTRCGRATVGEVPAGQGHGDRTSCRHRSTSTVTRRRRYRCVPAQRGTRRTPVHVLRRSSRSASSSATSARSCLLPTAAGRDVRGLRRSRAPSRVVTRTAAGLRLGVDGRGQTQVVQTGPDRRPCGDEEASRVASPAGQWLPRVVPETQPVHRRAPPCARCHSGRPRAPSPCPCHSPSAASSATAPPSPDSDRGSAAKECCPKPRPSLTSATPEAGPGPTGVGDRGDDLDVRRCSRSRRRPPAWPRPG